MNGIWVKNKIIITECIYKVLLINVVLVKSGGGGGGCERGKMVVKRGAGWGGEG